MAESGRGSRRPLPRTPRVLNERRGRIVTEDVAILGISCRAPGAATYDELWSLLLQGRVVSGRWPETRRCLSGAWVQGAPANGDAASRLERAMNGGYLDDVASFDAELFGISTREACAMDPQHRLLLEAAWSALQDGGIDPRSLAGSPTGIYMGLSSYDYGLIGHEAGFQGGPYLAIGNAKSLAANRISYCFGLAGPSFGLDAACSSALVCVHLAARAVATGECDLALAGGANLILAPDINVSFSRARMLSSSGRCRSFQKTADGYVRSEGVGVVVLKRLSDALRDGDPVRAVIAGSAVNQDGRTLGITVPSETAQVDLIRTAWRRAGITVDDIDAIEAHATGTPVGDAAELHVLSTLLERRSPERPPCLVASLKANLGHTEAAAGILSLVKMVRLLETREVPPHVADGDLLDLPAAIDGRLAFPSGRTRLVADGRATCAGVSAFGFGGTNCHVVLKSAPPADRPATAPGPVLLTLSAGDRAALQQLVDRWALLLAEMSPQELADAAHTSNAAYAGEPVRLWVVAGTPADAAAALRARAAGDGAGTRDTARLRDLSAAGERWEVGEALPLEAVVAAGSRRRNGMPTYPFRHQAHWFTHVAGPQAPAAAGEARGDCDTVEISFRDMTYLRDHRIDGEILVPAGVLVDLALSWAASRLGRSDWVVEDAVFHHPTILDEALSARVQLSFQPAGEAAGRPADRVEFEFRRDADGAEQSQRLATGILTYGDIAR